MKHDPSKYIIMLGFASLLSLLSIVAFVSILQMNRTLDSMSNLVMITNAKITHANQMRDFLRLRGNVLTSITQTNKQPQPVLLTAKLDEYTIGYKQAQQDFKKFHISTTGRSLLNDVERLETISGDLTTHATELVMSNASRAEINVATTAANDAHDKTIRILTKLIALQETNARNALSDSVNYQKMAQTIIILLTLTSLLVGILISLFVLRETSRKNSEIRFQASHDALTKLINRKEFESRLETALEKSHTEGRVHALCFLDLDQFKVINDTCGHTAGDELLCQLTQVINKHVREHDTLSRLGGDEFGLLLEDCTLESAIEIAEGIIRVVNKYEFHWQEKVHHVGVSIGITPINRKTTSVTKAMSEADIACYAAKDMGRNQLHVHELTDVQVKRMHKELSWVADIQNSLKDNRFKLYVQPIHTASGKLPEIRMYEILLRLKDDEGNVSSPGNYIPAAERFGLMRDVDQWVVEQVIQTLHTMPNTDNICLFVNLSANTLSDKNFCNQILKLMDEYKVNGNSICFEITETTAVRNIRQAIDFIKTLKQTNCFFALDDFGAGMSSFSYLKDLPVDYIKIDGSLVTNLHSNNVSHAMVAAINEVGNVMKIKTIAEHVENEMTMLRLNDIGVSFVQGFHFGMPRPIETLRLSSVPKGVSEPTVLYNH